MRIVTYGAACSLDGFIATADGGVDWLVYGKEVGEIMATYWATIDTVLMGRKTWEFAAANAPPDKADDSGIRSYVFSRTLKRIDRPGVELVSDDAGGFVRRLKARPGKGICVLGGGNLARGLLEAGVIDEVGMNVHPVLLGSGIPLFGDAGRRIALGLAESRAISGGCVYLRYRVKRTRSKS